MARATRIVVLETSALLATLQNFRDSHPRSPDAPEALDSLLTPTDTGKPAIIDRIIIPDHVFYELTGILPISIPFMQRRFAAEKASGNLTELGSLIEMYVHASPRGSGSEHAAEIKDHIRSLLRFVANHPEALVRTQVAEQYCKTLKANYSMLSNSGSDSIKAYRPTFSDAFAHAGEDFHSRDLRIHIGQLMMMGLISEREYNDRMGEDENETGKKKRFVYTTEMIHRLEGKSLQGREDTPVTVPPGHERGLISEGGCEVIRQREKERLRKIKSDEARDAARYLTVAFFEDYQVLEASAKHYREKERYQLHKRDLESSTPSVITIRQALGPSPLLMEHYCYGGILPNTESSLFIAAHVLKLDTSSISSDMSPHKIRRHLHRLGFFEISPTVEQLEAIRTALHAANIEAPALDRFVVSVSKDSDVLKKKFVEANRMPNDSRNAPIAYEKMLSDALVNGAMSWDEYLAIIERTGGLPRRIDGKLANNNADIIVDTTTATVAFEQKSITHRKGAGAVGGYLSGAALRQNVEGKERHYFSLPVAELIARCHAQMVLGHRQNTQLYRVIEAMLYPAVLHDAAMVRTTVQEVLGEDRLVQVEKDFVNRHVRKHSAVAPPYQDIFSALHVTSRITRKNLGEVATLEAAQAASAADPDAELWLINHDSDLFPHPEHGRPQLERSIPRQHAGLMPTLHELNYAAATNPRLHFVNTVQFLDTLSAQLGLHESYRYRLAKHGKDKSPQEARFSYGVLHKKIVDRISNSWQHHIQQEVTSGIIKR